MIDITFYEKYKLSIILILYFITFYFIFSAEPSFLFNTNGTFRDFGAGESHFLLRNFRIPAVVPIHSWG